MRRYLCLAPVVCALALAACMPMTPETQVVAFCAELAPSSAPELVVPYIKNKYPEQGIEEVDPRRLNSRSDATLGAYIWSSGDWIIEDHALDSSRVGKVIVTNTATGFRWEGQVTEYQEAPSGPCINGLWYQKVVETSVELPAPGVITRTPAPTSMP